MALGVRISTVSPGFIRSLMRASAARTSDSRDVNACIDRLLRSDDLRRRGGSASMKKRNYNGIELGIYPPKLSAPAERLELLLQQALLVRFPVGARLVVVVAHVIRARVPCRCARSRTGQRRRGNE